MLRCLFLDLCNINLEHEDTSQLVCFPFNGNYGGIDIDGVRSFDSQRFGIGVTLKFGNQKAKTSRKESGALDDELDRISN